MATKPKNKIIFFNSLLLCCVFCTYAFANPVSTGNQAAGIVQTFQHAVSGWDTVLKGYTLRLFSLLLILDIAWIGIRFALERPQLPDLIKQITLTIFFACIFLAAINHCKEWSWQIISQFQDIAKILTPGFVDSSSPLKIGLSLCRKILSTMSLWSPIDSIVYALSAFIILICFALLSAQIIFIKCEVTLAMAAAMILLGFGGARVY